MVVAPPLRPRLEPEPEALIEEARERQRRRRLLTGLALGVLLVAGASAYLLVDRSGGPRATRAPAAAPIAAGCPPAPAPHFGSLGAVAYVRGTTLRVVDLASGGDRAFTSIPRLPKEPFPTMTVPPVNWSPDGRWLTAGSTIVAAATGASCTPFGRSASLTWFPNRDALIVGTKQGRYLVASAGHHPRPLLPEGFYPAGPVSPDGTKVAAGGPRTIPTRTPDSLWIFDIRTARRYLLWSTRSWNVGPPTAARWSPDGRWVLFEPDAQGSGSIAADGLPLLAVPVGEGPTDRVEPRVLTPPDFLQSCGPSGALAVSAGGDRYLSASKRIDLIVPPTWKPRDVSRDPTRSWYAASCSPDGTVLAATTTVNRDEGGFDRAERSIWLLSRDGSHRRLLVGKPGDRLSDEQPRWSHDGRWILYLEHPAHFGTTAQLYLVDVKTGARRGPFGRIAGGGYYGYHDWNELAAWYQPYR